MSRRSRFAVAPGHLAGADRDAGSIDAEIDRGGGRLLLAGGNWLTEAGRAPCVSGANASQVGE